MTTKAALHNFIPMFFIVSSDLQAYSKDTSTQMPKIPLQKYYSNYKNNQHKSHPEEF